MIFNLTLGSKVKRIYFLYVELVIVWDLEQIGFTIEHPKRTKRRCGVGALLVILQYVQNIDGSRKDDNRDEDCGVDKDERKNKSCWWTSQEMRLI